MTRLADIDHNEQRDEISIKTVVDQLLSRRIFVGVYIERRWVDLIKEFRDVIVINSTGNEELLKDFRYSLKRLRELYGDSKWIGMTGPDCIGAPSGYCLWVKTRDLPLGLHEFCIEKVRFTDSEVYTSVKSLKLIDANVESEMREDLPTANVITSDVIYSQVSDVYANTCEKIVALSGRIYCLLKDKEMPYNVFLLVVTTVVLLWQMLAMAIKGVGEFTLRFMSELTKLLKVIMPLILSLMDLLKKVIGGIFILIAMVYRSFTSSRNRSQYPPVNYKGRGNMAMAYGPTRPYQSQFNQFNPNGIMF